MACCWLFYSGECLSTNANNRNQNNCLSDHQASIVSQVWLCDYLLPRETHLLSKTKVIQTELGSSREHVGSSGLAEESTHPQTVRTVLSFIVAPIARRELELPCPSKRDLWQVQVQSASEISPSHASSHLSCNHPQNGFKLPLPVSKHRQAASCLWHQVQKNKTN